MATFAQELALEQLYIAYFGRAAEPSGFAFFLNGITAGTDSLPHIANEFANSPESHLLYPFLGLSASTPITPTLATGFINQVYHNLFNRDADSVGLAYYSSILTASNAGDVINGIANGASGSDIPALQGKDLAALNYTTSITDATYSAGDSVAAVAGAYTLTPDTDVATANIFNAPMSHTGLLSLVNTLQDNDILTGVGSNPTLNAILGTIDGFNAGAESHIVTPKLTNIQTINLDFVGNGGPTSTTTILFAEGWSGGHISAGTSTTITTTSGAGAVDTLDLQDANANSVKSININRITDPVNSVAVVNIPGVPTNFSVNNTHSPTASVSFSVLDSYLKPGADGLNHSSTTVTLNNVSLEELNLNSSGDAYPTWNPGISTDASPAIGNVDHWHFTHDGYLNNTPNVVASANGIENVTLVSKGSANSLYAFSDVDLTTLTIVGAQDLSIENIGYKNQGKFTTINGSLATGNLSLSLDSLQAAAVATPYLTTGGDVAFSLTTGSGNDTIYSTINFGSHDWVNPLDHTLGFNDVVDGGKGFDTLAFSSCEQGGGISSGSTDVSFSDNATYHNFEAVTVTRTGHAQSGTGNALDMWVDSANITDENLTGQTFSLVNKQYSSSSSNHNQTNYYLEHLSPTEATAITISHSGANAQSTGNNGLNDNVIYADIATDTINDTVGVTIANGTNSDPRFNFTLEARTGGTVGAFGSGAVENITITDSDSESNTVLVDAPASLAGVTGTVTLSGGHAGQFLNLDASINANKEGYGLDTTGGKADVAVTDHSFYVATGGSVTKAGLLDGLGLNTVGGLDRVFVSSALTGEVFVAKNIIATAEQSDVVIRVGEATQNIQLGSGNDTVIFSDYSGLTANSAGLTVNDTVAGGAGFDTLIVDGAGVETLGASEWTNLSGIDAIRLGNWAGDLTAAESEFHLTITNDLVAQTDNHTRLYVVNNSGIYGSLGEDATVDLTQLDAHHYVTFVGPNGTTGYEQNEIQTLIVNDTTANGNQYLDGGDRDILLNTGNANILQINSPVTFAVTQVTADDLVHTKNFQHIEFHDTAAIDQTLVLTLTDAVVDALADAGHTASASAHETLYITAVDNLVGHALLDVEAGTLTAPFDLDVTGSAGIDTIITGAGDDTINVLGSHEADNDIIHTGLGLNTLNLWGSDHVFANDGNLTGISVVNLENTFGEAVNLGAQSEGFTINGNSGIDVIVGGQGDNTIYGGGAGDILTGSTSGGKDTFVYKAATDSHATSFLSVDHITNFDAAKDTIDLHVIAVADSFTSAHVATPVTSGTVGIINFVSNINSLVTGVGGAFTGETANELYAVTVHVTAGTLSGSDFLVVDTDHSGSFTSADLVINITGITHGPLTVSNLHV